MVIDCCLVNRGMNGHVCNPVRQLAEQRVFLQVDECNSNRLKMMAEAAESSTAVKVLVVKVSWFCHPLAVYCTSMLFVAYLYSNTSLSHNVFMRNVMR